MKQYSTYAEELYVIGNVFGNSFLHLIRNYSPLVCNSVGLLPVIEVLTLYRNE